MAEHPFAQYVRILGKGPKLSRPLTQNETRDAVGMILRGEVEPVQLGAFLTLIRVRIESPAEVAGFALAIRDTIHLSPHLPAVDLDWPSYAGKSRQLPLFILSALLLAKNGFKIAMHGTENHTAGRLYTRDALAALGITAADGLAGAAAQLSWLNFSYIPMEHLHPRLPKIMELKELLGLRSPLHTVARNLNPLNARASLMSVFHPNYRAIHRDAALLMGQERMACFKGEGGEIERRPEKPCVLEGAIDGIPFEEEWPPLPIEAPATNLGMDPTQMGALWHGDLPDPYAETVIFATAAIALRLIGKAETPAEADALARKMWNERPRDLHLAKPA